MCPKFILYFCKLCSPCTSLYHLSLLKLVSCWIWLTWTSQNILFNLMFKKFTCSTKIFIFISTNSWQQILVESAFGALVNPQLLCIALILSITTQVDTVKKKRYLLELADRLTCKKLRNQEAPTRQQWLKMSEDEVWKEVKRQSGWPHFHQVFMVSALEGLGVGEVMVRTLRLCILLFGS